MHCLPATLALCVLVQCVLVLCSGALGAIQNPLAAPEEHNPLAQPPKAEPESDPFARTFEGDGLKLVLERADVGHTGTLTVQGESHGVAVQVTPPALYLRVEGVEPRLEFEGSLEGEVLTLRSSGKAFTLLAVRPPGAPQIPPPLEGVGGGPTRPYSHPKDYFRCRLPNGWTVPEVGYEALLINPGLGPNDNLDALIVVGWGELDEVDRNRSAMELMEQYEPDVRVGLRETGILLRKPEGPAQRVLVGDLPGAEQTWRGKTTDGQALSLWIGALVKREYYLSVIAVIAEGQEERFLAGSKQLFTSLVPTPPKRNPALERALVGLQWSETSYTDVGFGGGVPDSTGSSYTFHEDGAVKSFWYLSGGVGYDLVASTSITDWGSYEVFGSDIYIYMPSGQLAGTVVVEHGRPVGIQLGSRLHGLN